LKIRVFFGWYKFVNAYVEGDKKNFEKMDFCSYPPAFLIDLAPLAAGDFLETKNQSKMRNSKSETII